MPWNFYSWVPGTELIRPLYCLGSRGTVAGSAHGFVTVQMHAGGHVLQVVMGVVVHLYVGIVQGSVY